MRRLLLIMTCSIVLVTACASQPVEKRRYTLHPAVAAPVAGAAPTVALGKVEVAPYLRHEGIVVETASGEVRNARHNLWAESLDYSIRRYLQVQIREQLGAPVALHEAGAGNSALTVDVHVHQLHGTESGILTIAASWVVRNEQDETGSTWSEFVATEKLTTDGYPALVQGHKALLDALAKNIAAAITGTRGNE